MREGRDRLASWASRLSIRLAALLSLALVPLGLIAVNQTNQLQRELERVQALNLRTLTAEVARREGESIEMALGAAQALAAALPPLLDDPQACSRALSATVGAFDGRLTFAGHVPQDGMMVCASSGAPRDVSGRPGFAEQMARRQPFVTSAVAGAISGEPVLTAHVPLTVGPGEFGTGEFGGFLSISISESELAMPLPPRTGEDGVELALVDGNGAVLGASVGREAAARLLPDPKAGGAPPGQRRGTFTATGADGTVRRYAVVPVVEGVAHAVGIRPLHAAGPGGFLIAPETFPILMWLVSLTLVLGAVDGALGKPVRRLSALIRRFGQSRELPGAPLAGALPAELSAIEASFRDVARRLLREEAELIHAMHEKDVLLKEVHHRVKNNLQTISSIVNLQVRAADAPETEAALEKVNARIASLAAVHRRIYLSERLGAVRADGLLRDILGPLMQATAPADPGATPPDLDLALSPVVLTPDQCLPAAMLTVEAVTSAVKAAPSGPSGTIRVALSQEADQTVCLRIESAAPPDVAVEGGAPGRQRPGPARPKAPHRDAPRAPAPGGPAPGDTLSGSETDAPTGLVPGGRQRGGQVRMPVPDMGGPDADRPDSIGPGAVGPEEDGPDGDGPKGHGPDGQRLDDGPPGGKGLEGPAQGERSNGEARAGGTADGGDDRGHAAPGGRGGGLRSGEALFGPRGGEAGSLGADGAGAGGLADLRLAEAGLGERLIRAFARQLGAEIRIGREAGRHVVALRFRPLPVAPQTPAGPAPDPKPQGDAGPS